MEIGNTFKIQKKPTKQWNFTPVHTAESVVSRIWRLINPTTFNLFMKWPIKNEMIVSSAWVEFLEPVESNGAWGWEGEPGWCPECGSSECVRPRLSSVAPFGHGVPRRLTFTCNSEILRASAFLPPPPGWDPASGGQKDRWTGEKSADWIFRPRKKLASSSMFFVFLTKQVYENIRKGGSR